ncbi:hypothetical protein L2E81_09125 [Planktothrix agardhii 1033]|nr:hypothetical protein [Planktothrix agardhii 1033]
MDNKSVNINGSDVKGNVVQGNSSSAEAHFKESSTIDQSRNINISGGTVNAGALNLGNITGTINNTINQLPASDNPNKPGIKELLGELTEAIASDKDLSEKDKTKALKQVQALAEAGQNPKDEEKKDIADTAITMLKGIVAGLPSVATAAKAVQELLPLIMPIFGL